MEYTLEDVFNKVAERIDIVYLIDTSSDTYITIKDNKLFHGLFGRSGLYSKMMSVFLKVQWIGLCLKVHHMVYF